MTSGILWGICTRILVVCDINDLDVNVDGLVSMFADYTKIRGVGDSEKVYQNTQ